MAGIFISYASEDRSKVKLLAKALEDHGCSVWWDRDLPYGLPFDELIRTELRAARCVVSLWTENSANFLYVIGEARDALRLKKLISVWEWVQDRYGDYPTGPIPDPKGPDKGEYRVLRGGSWSHFARILRSAYRGSNFPDDRSDGDGFRVARDF